MKKQRIELTKKFMEEHGKKKSQMKVSWNEYISTLEKQGDKPK